MRIRALHGSEDSNRCLKSNFSRTSLSLMSVLSAMEKKNEAKLAFMFDLLAPFLISLMMFRKSIFAFVVSAYLGSKKRMKPLSGEPNRLFEAKRADEMHLMSLPSAKRKSYVPPPISIVMAAEEPTLNAGRGAMASGILVIWLSAAPSK